MSDSVICYLPGSGGGGTSYTAPLAYTAVLDWDGVIATLPAVVTLASNSVTVYVGQTGVGSDLYTAAVSYTAAIDWNGVVSSSQTVATVEA